MGNFLNIIVDENHHTNGKSKIDLFNISTQWLSRFLKDSHHRIKFCEFEDIPKNPDENFLYVVNRCIYGFSDFIRNSEKIELSVKVLEYLKYKNFKLVFIDSHEAFGFGVFEKIYNTCLHNNLDQKQVYVIDDDYNKNLFKKKLNSEINIFQTNEHLDLMCNELLNYQLNFIENKEFLFLCHNKVIKGHRIIILLRLMKMGILEKTNWSFLYPEKLKETLFKHGDENINTSIFSRHFYNTNTDIQVKYKHEKEFLKDHDHELKILYNMEMKKSKYENTMDWYYMNPNSNAPIKGQWEGHFYEPKSYEESYINITTESNYLNGSTVHVTEKSFIPFFSYQLPIFLASYKHVNSLREKYNLDMFDDLIDHGYDNEQNNSKRMDMICEEIKRLSDNENEVREFYKRNFERFENNRKIIIDYNKKNIDGLYIENNIVGWKM